jgi:uncharacterized Tic20 family protein
MFAHLSALLGMLVGGLSFLGPLIIWLMKKDESKFVDYHGKEALNFQLNVLVYGLIALAVGTVVGTVTCGIGFFLLIPLLGGVGIYGIIMPILAGMKANEGKYYEYPATVRVIK